MSDKTRQRHSRHNVRITIVLMVAIGLLVFVSTILVLFLSGRTALKNTVELLHESADMTISGLESEIETHIRPVEYVVERFVEMAAEGELDPHDMEAFLGTMRGVFAAAPQITGISFWDKSGLQYGLLQHENGDLQTIVRDASDDELIMSLLQGDLSSHQARWRPPGYEQGRTFIFVSSALLRDGEPLGLLAVGVSLNRLSEFVAEIGRKYDMTAFILLGDSHVLAHPALLDGALAVDEENPLVSLEALDDPVLELFHETEPIEEARARGLTVREAIVDGDHHLILSRESWAFSETVWHIGIHSPAHTLDKQLVRLITSILAGLGVLIVSVIAAILLARYIARPIRTLAGAAESIGRLELNNIASLPRSRIKELDDQSLAFNRMLEGLKWFETYVPKRLVDRLIAGQVDQSVASREAELTVMFTDIIGFTAMSERMGPSDVGRMLNHHFETLSACIEEEGGTLDKYIGDAVMAFWGAPEQQDDHALRACRAAMRMAAAMARDDDSDHDLPKVRLKIAIHTGPLLVGNIGARSRMNYTVIGDTVNTCSRIESLCSQVDDGSTAVVLISDDTLKRTPAGACTVEPAGSFEVKGRREPVSVSRLLDVSEE